MGPNDLINSVGQYLQSLTVWDIFWKLLASLLLLLAAALLQRAIGRLVRARSKDGQQLYRRTKTSRYLISGLVLALIAGIWLTGFSDMATIIAIVGAGLAIALRDPIVDLGGWAYIVVRGPFQLGDRVSIAGRRGDVVDIGPFVFSLMEVGDSDGGPRQSTGRMIQVPNMMIFSEPLVNENLGFNYVWHEVSVVVPFESDWQKAKAILTEIVERHAGHLAPSAEEQQRAATTKYMVAFATFMPRVYTRVVGSGVELTMRFLSEVRKPRDMEEAIWEDVLRAFAAEPDVDLAYPTSRVFRANEESRTVHVQPAEGRDQGEPPVESGAWHKEAG